MQSECFFNVKFQMYDWTVTNKMFASSARGRCIQPGENHENLPQICLLKAENKHALSITFDSNSFVKLKKNGQSLINLHELSIYLNASTFVWCFTKIIKSYLFRLWLFVDFGISSVMSYSYSLYFFLGMSTEIIQF